MEAFSMNKSKIFLFVVILMSFSMLLEAAPNYSDPVTIKGKLERNRLQRDVGDRDVKDYFMNGVQLEFGNRNTIRFDYNKDGQIMAISRELVPMINKQVRIKGYRDDRATKNIIYVTEIDGMAYPNTKIESVVTTPTPTPNPGTIELRKKPNPKTSDN